MSIATVNIAYIYIYIYICVRQKKVDFKANDCKLKRKLRWLSCEGNDITRPLDSLRSSEFVKYDTS